MEIEQGLEGLAAVLLLGFAARWIAWRLHLPSILLPFVSISVALILFEGGLGLSFRDLKGVGGVIRNLVTLGAAVTWAAAAFLTAALVATLIGVANALARPDLRALPALLAGPHLASRPRRRVCA